MQRIDTIENLSPDDYEKAIRTLKAFTVIALRWLFEQSPGDTKHAIIMNFIARGIVCLDSIHTLWKSGSYQDCWILHRALVDRLIHLHRLIQHEEFEEFERWSFQEQWQTADVTFSDPSLTEKVRPEALAEAKKLHTERRSRIRQEPKSSWRRPNAKKVAKAMNLPFVYSLGYDAASAEVHPMADDGKEELHALLGIPLPSYGDSRTILHNSILMQYLLVQHGMRGCDVLWRGFVSDFLGHWFAFLEHGTQGELIQAMSVIGKGANVSWCEPQTGDKTEDLRR